jgi:D-lactate dehydrogenase
VYFPACVNRIFGNAPEDERAVSVPEAMVAVSGRAGMPLWIPPDVAGRCCATPWSSKGFAEGRALMSSRVAASILDWTDGGRLPLVVDATSCTLGLLREVPEALDEGAAERFREVRIIDSIEWVHDSLLPALAPPTRVHSVAVHPPCAAVALGLAEKLRAVVAQLADEAIVPAASGCCGTAGDRGLLHPELPAAALAPVADELAGHALSACVCSNRTCEIGLTQVTGRPYESFVQLLEQLTREPGASGERA